jgi:hypothetical protein
MSDNVFSQVPPPTQNPSLEIPIDSITLPSKGTVYDQSHPLYNESTVEIRCMTAREEDILSSNALLKNGTVLEKLMEACLLNKTVDASTLLLGDRNAILIAIRITGYGSEYGVKVDCPKCKKTADYDLTLNGLNYKPLTATPVRPNTNVFSYTLPLSKAVVEFKLLTGRDIDEVNKIQKAMEKLGGLIDKSVTLRLKKQILSVNGTNSDEYISKFVDSMRAGDARALRSYVRSIEPDVDMSQTIQCKHCTEESEVEIPFGMSFFWPDITD